MSRLIAVGLANVWLFGLMVIAKADSVTVQQSTGMCWDANKKQVDCSQVGIRFSPTTPPLEVKVVDGSVTVTGGTEDDLRHEIIRAHTELRGFKARVKQLNERCRR